MSNYRGSCLMYGVWYMVFGVCHQPTSLEGVGILFSTASMSAKMASLPNLGSPPDAAASALPFTISMVSPGNLYAFSNSRTIEYGYKYGREYGSSYALWACEINMNVTIYITIHHTEMLVLLR
ncbi:hypothetical protein EON63_08775 [archaeon]|nr:MAG: hypothetical protein EON63_08775 [archaeon]